MKKLSGWQKAGLFVGIGCFSIAALCVLALVAAVFWARATLRDVGDTTPTKVERTIPVPAVAAAPGDAGATASGSAAAAPMRLTIDLEEGDFTVQPGAAGTPVQVQGEFSPNLFELTDERAADGGAPRATIRFRSKAPGWARMLAGITGGSSNRPALTVVIPEGTPIELDLRLAMGQSRVDLGGLALRDLAVQMSMGDHRIDFSKPVAGEIGRARFDGNMGNVAVSNLGNARAQAVEVSGNMGNMTADLGGTWEAGTEADLSFSHNMGQVVVRVPTSVRLQSDVRNEQGQESYQQADPAKDDPSAPHVRLRVSTSMGGSRVVRY